MLEIITNIHITPEGQTIDVGFSEIPLNALYKPFLRCSDGRTARIPLLLNKDDIHRARILFDSLESTDLFRFDYLKLIVAGACSMAMKKKS